MYILRMKQKILFDSTYTRYLAQLNPESQKLYWQMSGAVGRENWNSGLVGTDVQFRKVRELRGGWW